MSKLIIVDDFYKEPEHIRNLALNARYTDVKKMNYPGIQSDLSFSNQETKKQFETIMGSQLSIDSKKYTFGKFRIMIDEKYKFKAHLDGLTKWTALCYLNSPLQCTGGTSFYKHISSGLEGPLPLDQVQNRGFKSNEEMFEKLIGDDKYDPKKWEVTDSISMKFNRLIIFQGYNYFHCHTSSFGNTKENGRMTQLFFFN